MNTRPIDIPIGMVLSAGTYHGTSLYAPVHPSQKEPRTSNGAPTAAPYKRSSGGGKPRHSLIRSLYLILNPPIQRLDTAPTVVPMPTPRKISPHWLIESPWWPIKITGNASNTELLLVNKNEKKARKMRPTCVQNSINQRYVDRDQNQDWFLNKHLERSIERMLQQDIHSPFDFALCMNVFIFDWILFS
jgi:hypothetical protein